MRIQFLFLLILVGCLPFGKKPGPFKMRFQNMVGLELSYAGCSLVKYGGLDRMCHYTANNQADLFFQVGPSLSQIELENGPVENVSSKREVLWKEWERQGVEFYCVDALDLGPSLAAFQAVAHGKIKLISSNLQNEKGEFLFNPFFEKRINGKKFVFFSFAENGHRGPGWRTQDVEASFRELIARFPKVDAFYIAGTLSKSMRRKIASLSERPVIFFGGEFKESNTIAIEKESERGYFVKAPDLGRGLGELEIDGEHGDKIGGTSYQYWATILRRVDSMTPECSSLSRRIAEVTDPGSCALSRIGDCSVNGRH